MYGAFSIGLALTIGILFASKLSLGALNPAVAVALWAKKAINLPTMIVYILAEVIGGLCSRYVKSQKSQMIFTFFLKGMHQTLDT